MAAIQSLSPKKQNIPNNLAQNCVCGDLYVWNIIDFLGLES